MINNKKKIISETLDRKTNELAEILPSHLVDDFLENCFVAGGAIYSIYNNDCPKDYDFFFKSRDIADKFRDYFNMNSTLKYKNGVKVGRYKGYPLIVTNNAISIGKFQLIFRWIGMPLTVVEEFDFKHNQSYYDYENVVFHSGIKYLETNHLFFNENRPRDIANCIVRVNKFLDRGFVISNKEVSSMLIKLHDVGFSESDLEMLDSRINGRTQFGSGD